MKNGGAAWTRVTESGMKTGLYLLFVCLFFLVEFVVVFSAFCCFVVVVVCFPSSKPILVSTTGEFLITKNMSTHTHTHARTHAHKERKKEKRQTNRVTEHERIILSNDNNCKSQNIAMRRHEGDKLH